jgi:hypothetical protein
MGAWDEQPVGNDEAQEWLADSVVRPMMDAINAALSRFLADESDDVNKAQAEAAAALLIDLADLKDRPKYVLLDGANLASQLGAWNKAIAAIRLLISQKKWLSEWSRPEDKAKVLEQLLNDLEIAAKEMA